ncbi:hypothetical protein AB0O07_21650 [Streptomyces sp. NPDC093085]|uniref:hypothetical protein n=1 Tax=Streptomyces sp. NPDC093085 TaxID=3155068 RepID=UPI00341A3599
MDPAGVRHGDQYDDVTQELHSSANVAFSRYDKIPDSEYPQRETKSRKALVEAKRKLATALTLLQNAGNTPSGPLLQALGSGFPVFRTASPEEIAKFIPHIITVLKRVQIGLNANGAEIALVNRPPAPSVAGWVDPNLTTRLKQTGMKSENPPSIGTGSSGPIHLTEKGQEAWTIIHEATHKYSGTLDFQYSSYDAETNAENFESDMASIRTPEAQAAAENTLLTNRRPRDPRTYTGDNETENTKKQQNWYAMGKRALMNADSYAQFVLAATGSQIPRT